MSAGPGALKVFASGRMTAILVMGFASGLPVAMYDSTLGAWLASAGVDLTTVGIMALVGLPASLKFLWAPLMDRFVPPLLGRRRGWMLLVQLALIAAIAAMGVCGISDKWLIASLALVVAVLSASQDIVVDAYRTEALAPREFGAGASVGVMGWRLGWLCSSSMALMAAKSMGWQWAYMAMAGCMAVPVIATVLSPEPKAPPQAPRTVKHAVVEPLRDLLGRFGWLALVEIAAFIFVYKLDWALVYRMTKPFLISQGHALDVLALIDGVGIATTIAGGLVGGAALTRISVRQALWVFGLMQGLAGLSFAAAAAMPPSFWTALVAVCVESFCTGLATSAFVAFIMSLCDRRFTATQYALLSAIMMQSRIVGSSPAGAIAQAVGWPVFFLLSLAVAVPGLALLLRYNSWMARKAATQAELQPAEA
jgi:PAT family beta-lactamase induction signal transducer AmpG